MQGIKLDKEPFGRNIRRPRFPRLATVDVCQRIDIEDGMHDAQDIADFMNLPANAMHSL